MYQRTSTDVGMDSPGITHRSAGAGNPEDKDLYVLLHTHFPPSRPWFPLPTSLGIGHWVVAERAPTANVPPLGIVAVSPLFPTQTLAKLHSFPFSPPSSSLRLLVLFPSHLCDTGSTSG